MAKTPRDTARPASAPDAEPAAGASRLRGPRPKLGHYTIHDVAALAGVSSVTASRFFNEPHRVSEKLRERLQKVIADTGYMPSQVARRLASSQGGVVGAVMQNMGTPTFASMVQGMSDTLERHGLLLLLANSHHSLASEWQALRTFIGWHPAALVLTRGDHAPETDALLAGLRIPVVETWDVLDDRPFHQVGFSQQQVGEMLTRHFLDQGARRIRFVLNGVAGDVRARRRAAGYEAAMQAAGLVPDVQRMQATDDIAAAEEALAQWCAEPAEQRPRAIVFAYDAMAVATVLRARAHGLRVPEDCAVAGFGDAPVSAILEPALTTVRTRPYDIGVRTASVLIELLEPHGPGAPQTHRVDCELVVRASSRVS